MGPGGLAEPVKMNLKIFGNGKMIITGGLKKEEAIESVEIIRRKIQDLKADYQVSPCMTIVELFPTVASYLKFIKKNYLVLLLLFSKYSVKVNLRLDVVLNDKTLSNYYLHEAETNNYTKVDLTSASWDFLLQHNLLFSGSQKDLQTYTLIVQIYNICHHYYSNAVLLDKLNQPTHPLQTIINNLYQMQMQCLQVTFEPEALAYPFTVTIENYNTQFECGFHLDREKLTHVLDTKYRQQGLIASAMFEPTNYQGVNAKYISRILCHSGCQSTGKNGKCPCKEVSFLIFQEGNIIVTGGRAWEQMTDGYNVLIKILKEEYEHIRITQLHTEPSVNEHWPDRIVDQTENGDTVIYLKKKHTIMENPRNYFLLKQLGLLSMYVKDP